MKIFGPAAASRNSAVFGGSSFGFLLLLITVAATSATQTAAIAFLPSLIEGGAVIPVAATHDFHIVSLSASFPLAALGLAPIWGWLADRMDYRVLLRIALLVLAATTLAFGSTDLATLYLLRILICPLLSGPKLMIFWTTKEIRNAEQEASPGRDYWQAA